MNNEPVAIRYDFDGYGYQYMDSGSGSDWQTRVKGEPLYTHPVKELDRELLDKTIIDQQNEIKDLRKNLDVALMIVNKPELTDEEIDAVGDKVSNLIDTYAGRREFARAILLKAQEK